MTLDCFDSPPPQLEIGTVVFPSSLSLGCSKATEAGKRTWKGLGFKSPHWGAGCACSSLWILSHQSFLSTVVCYTEKGLQNLYKQMSSLKWQISEIKVMWLMWLMGCFSYSDCSLPHRHHFQGNFHELAWSSFDKSLLLLAALKDALTFPSAGSSSVEFMPTTQLFKPRNPAKKCWLYSKVYCLAAIMGISFLFLNAIPGVL